MADSILEQIAQDVLDTVEAVTGISSASRAVQRNNFLVEDKGAVIEQESTDAPEYLTGGPAIVEWMQPFSIHLFRLVSETSTTAIDALFNAVVADVQKALAADPTRGGLAIDTHLGGVDYYVDETGNLNEAVVRIIVTYRVSEADPYTQR